MNKTEFIAALKEKNVQVIDVNTPTVLIEAAGQQVHLNMRSFKTTKPKEIIDFIAKSGTVAFVYEVNYIGIPGNSHHIIRGNYA